MTDIALKPILAPIVNNLTTVSTLDGINIQWNNPDFDDPNKSIEYETELWYSETNNRDTAIKATSTVNDQWNGLASSKGEYYFWIRGINIYGRPNGPWYPADPLAGIYGTSGSASGVSSGGGSGSSSYFSKDTWNSIGGTGGVIKNIDLGTGLLTVKGVMNIDINPTITGNDDITIDLRFSIVDEIDSHTVVDEINTAVMQIDVSAGYPMPTILPVYLTSLGNYVDPAHTYKFLVEYMVKSSGNPNGSVGYTYTTNQFVVVGN